VTLFALCFLITRTVLPSSNLILFWPVGLLCLMVAMYGGYWWIWLTGVKGVSHQSAKLLFLILIIGFGGIALFRELRLTRESVAPRFGATIVAITVTALPFILIFIATARWGNDPGRLIAGFISGGDHNAHNEVTHNLLSWSDRIQITSPIEVYNYPNGIHFLIANLIALTSSGSQYSTLVQELRMGAWFEMVQLAAFAQLAIVVFVRRSRGSGLSRLIYIGPLVFVFAAMDNFVPHLFWWGFTTSLGITWIMLVPFVLPWDRNISESNQTIRVSWIAWGLILAYSAWIVYQPYAVLFGAVVFTLVVVKILSYQLRPLALRLLNNRQLIFISIAGGTTFLTAFLPFLISGKNSPAVASLVLDGSTNKPYFYSVAIWAVVALWALSRVVGPNKNMDMNAMIRCSVFIGLLSLTACMMLIVILTSDFTVLNQPYYTSKMLWIVLYVSIPIAVASVFDYFDELFLSKSFREKIGFGLMAVCCILLIPLVMGRLPKAAVTHFSIDWFAKGLLANAQVPGERTMAFTPGDVLGTHVSNLALRSFSGVVVPVELALSNDPIRACEFITNESVSLVYTSGNGNTELLAAGCSSELTYVVDGAIKELENPNYFSVPLDTDLDLDTLPAALQHMPAGILAYSKAGNFMTGIGSKFVFSLPQDLKDGVLRFEYVGVQNGPKDKGATVRINGKVQAEITLSPDLPKVITLRVPDGEKGDPIVVLIDCAWNVEEKNSVAKSEKPRACFKPLSARLMTNSSYND